MDEKERISLYIVLLFVHLSVALSVCPHQQSGFTRWSNDPSLPSANNPTANKDVTINSKILLDVSPPRLDGITVGPAGELVVSPASPITLATRFIHIHGRMDVGSEDCLFDGNFEVVLTGQRGAYSIPGFGEKFIGVNKGGTLEIHGKKKLSWTKLSKTVEKIKPSDYVLTHSGNGDKRDDWMEGIGIYAINPAQPTTRNYRVFYISGDPQWMYFVNRAKTEFPNFLKSIPDGWVVLVAVMKTMKNPHKWMDLTPFYDAMEDAFFGGKSSIFRTLENRDAYVMTAVKGDPDSVEEKVSRYRNGEESHEVSLGFTDSFNKYTVKSYVYNKNKWRSSTDFAAVPRSKAQPVIDVIDDVTTWEEGDVVFFTSTDYDMEQAERGRVIKCDSCTATQLKVDLIFKYTHFGEVEDRVDMRGEVGLLSRNVKVRGEMEAACTPTNGNCGACPGAWHNKNCGKYPYDTFGGHVKFLKGFTNVHVEGLELENMGQQTSLGNYPLHFHMCENVGDYPNPPYLRDNSIHDTFARCITIHGTHGVLVQDNVALDSLGHCYFLEDGGEKNNVFDGNLGAVIRKSRLIPADDEPSVFWLTNPLVTMINNVAAGSDHTGIWYLYPKEPIEASKGKGFMKNAEQTAITKADNNVVHSSFITGLQIDDLLNPDNTISKHRNDYEAREIPGDSKSPIKKVTISRVTAYKNRIQNIWFRGSMVEVTKSSMADSLIGITLARTKSKEAYLTDSVLVGESKGNLGEPSRKWSGNGWVDFPRALPAFWDEKMPRQGFVIYAGPVFGENLWFNGFKSTGNYTSGALSFIRNMEHWMAPMTSMKNIGFGFDDSLATGNRVFDGLASDYQYSNKDGDKGSTFIWQELGEQIVKPWPFYYTNQDCFMRENWKMVACKLIYGKLNVRVEAMGPGEKRPQLEMRRDDIPNEKETLTGIHTGQFTTILGGTHSYSLHWNGKIPKRFIIFGEAVQKSHAVRLAICMPKNADFDLWSYSPRWRPNKGRWRQVNDLASVDADPTGGKYMYDKNRGLLFVKFIGKADRNANMRSICAGHCPVFRVTIKSGDRNNGNCVGGMYPKYQRYPATSDGNIRKETNVIPKTSISPPASAGAGETRPFASRATPTPSRRQVDLSRAFNLDDFDEELESIL